MSYGIAVSLPGYDAMTCTPEQCAVHSDYPSPKMSESNWGYLGPYTFPVDIPTGDTFIYAVAHGFNYMPVVFVYRNEVTTNNYALLPVGKISSYVNENMSVYSDTTNFYIVYSWTNPGGGLSDESAKTFLFKYYIFTESGA